MAKDPYAILGVSRSASEAEIKAAYRKLSKELHPDKHKGDKDKESKFKDVNAAYEILSDPKKKQAYDQFGSSNGGNPFGGGGFGGFNGNAGFDPSQFGDSFSDIFESFFGGAQRGGRGQSDRTGRDIEVEVSIPFATAVKGEDRDIQFRTEVACTHCTGTGAEPGSSLVTCPQCSGTGQVTRRVSSLFGTIQQSSICPQCQGAGKIPEKACTVCKGEGRTMQSKTVSVHIPAGIADGQALRVTGQGEAGKHGGKAGDLYVRIRVSADPRFERDGDDTRSTLTIQVVDAVLGTQTDVETALGNVSLTIPAGTQPGQVFRIKGKGMPILNTSRHGDHYVTIEVHIPMKLSREERKVFEQLKGK